MRSGPHDQAEREDKPRPGLARGHRLLEEDRPAGGTRQLGFQTVGYGCTTCIGNSGPLAAAIEDVVKSEDLIAASRPLRQPQFRGARASEHQGELSDVAAAGRGIRARRDAWTSICRREPLGADADGRTRLSQGPLADAARRSATRCERAHAGGVPQALHAISPRRIRSGTKSRRAPGTVYEWDRDSHLHPGAAILRNSV